MTQAVNSCTKRSFRDRYYSSMNYEEYYLLFGPPTPIVKPLDDPTQDIPELCLESNPNLDEPSFVYPIDYLCSQYDSLKQKKLKNKNQDESVEQKLDPSQKGFQNSTNQTQSRNDNISFSPKKKETFTRARSKSDNTDYLIFTFMDKINKKGKKKIKLE